MITAAHCMYDYDDNKKIFDKFKPHEIAVRIGEHNLANINGVGETGIEEWRNIQQIHIHPDYPIKDKYIGRDMLGYEHDIAILELTEDVNLAKFTPACLAKVTDGTTFDGEKVTVVGWGVVPHPYFGPEGGIFTPTAVPYEVDLTVVENCKLWPDPWFMCAGFYEQEIKATCSVSLVLVYFRQQPTLV